MTNAALAVSRAPDPAKRYRLDHVSDQSLHADVKTLAGRHNTLTADLLAHLAEVESRGIHRERACSSLYTYCLYELRFSEDEAQRRARAARAAREFPVLFEMLADGAIHLTGLLLVAPYLTVENHASLLARARFRTKREIERMIAEVAPRPDVPGRLEPLGPHTPARVSSWQAFTASLRGARRDLRPGVGRGEAPPAVFDDAATNVGDRAFDVASQDADAGATGESEVANDGDGGNSFAPAPVVAEGAAFDAPVRVPLRYKVEFTASEAYVELLEEARDLLQHEVPDRDIGKVHELAMAAFVEQLRKRRHGATDRSRRGPPERLRRELAMVDESAPARMAGDGVRNEPASGADVSRGSAPARTRVAADVETGRESAPARIDAAVHGNTRSKGVGSIRGSAPARIGRTARFGSAPPTRHVPGVVRRVIWQRDEGRCTFTDGDGRRCEERACLEIHHELAFALGGPMTVENLRLVCRAHNALFAERDFGRTFVERKRRSDPKG